MLQLKKGIKLESLRLPFRKSLEVAAQLGAEGVEINARTEIRPDELSRTGVRHLKKMLGDLNLKVAAVHFPTRRGFGESDDLDRRIDATKNALAMAWNLGCNVVTNHIGTIPDEPEAPEWTTMVQALTDIGNHSQKAGAWLAAHSGINGTETMRQLLDSLPAMAIGIDFDPAAMIINGRDVIGGMKALGPQVMHFRARDAVYEMSMGRGLEVQLGRGSVNLPELLGILEEHNYNGFFTIERDSESEAILHCGQAVEYLDSLFE